MNKGNIIRAAPPARRGGRPSLLDAEQIRERILEAATALFLKDGYGATSIESIARQATISKRTFYHRFPDKAVLFGAVVQRLIAPLRPSNEAHLFEGETLEAILQALAQAILRAALSPNALALQRVLLAEAARFPELAAALEMQGARREAIIRIAGLLEREVRKGTIALRDPAFAAEQFLQMVVSAPQRRALGLGTPMTAPQLEAWARDAATLFLYGCRGTP